MLMNIENLYPAIARVREHRYGINSKQANFLRAYPSLISAVELPSQGPTDAFLRAASLSYAWMPRVLKLNDNFLSSAVSAFEIARGDGVTISQDLIDPIAACLSSLVGASKVLHLGNPAIFPLWNKQVERFRVGEDPNSYHMGQARNYLSFIEDVWSVTSDPMFLTFHHDYCTAYQERLKRLNIAPYPLTEPRVVQSATSELARDTRAW